MRKIATLIALTITALAVAEVPDFGTKQDIVVKTPEQTAPLLGAWDMVQMLVALGIVFALLKWALPKVVSKMNKKAISSSDGSIKVEESASFGGGNLQIVTARGRTLLLCVSQSSVSCLADLTEEKPKADEPAFFELVDQASEKDEETLRAVVEIPEEPVETNTAQDEAQAALARLERITG